MTKKITGAKKKAPKKITRSTKPRKKQEKNSMGVMILAIVGLIVLVWLSTTVSVNTEVNIDFKEELSSPVNESVMISGKSYISRQAAFKSLQFMPQSKLSDEEIKFVESYKD